MSLIKWTEDKIAERQKQGFGKGSGANYQPWLNVTDTASIGRIRRTWSSKTGRMHHLLSDVEFDVFVAAEWSRDVIDIREQYPLDRAITQTVAQDLKIAHPRYRGTDVVTVMTVDFLLTLAGPNGKTLLALNAKRDEEAEDETSLQKLEIQRSTLERLDITHHLVYHGRVPKQKVKNLSWVRDAQLKDGEIEQYPGYFNDFASRMARELLTMPAGEAETLLSEYCASFDQRYGAETGTGLRVARMLIHERALIADLEAPDLAKQPLREFQMTARSGGLRAA
jgi:hypothetical protein